MTSKYIIPFAISIILTAINVITMGLIIGAILLKVANMILYPILAPFSLDLGSLSGETAWPMAFWFGCLWHWILIALRITDWHAFRFDNKIFLNIIVLFVWTLLIYIVSYLVS